MKRVALDNGDDGFSIVAQSRGSMNSWVACGGTGMSPCLQVEGENSVPAWHCDDPLVIEAPGAHLMISGVFALPACPERGQGS